MKKFIKRLFLWAVLIAAVFALVRFGPNLYARLFGDGNTRWISEQFSETLREKNELMVCEVETTGQETVTQDAWLIGTVQKVEIPYTFHMSFTVDLSQATVTVNGNTLEVRVPSPAAGYQKLTVSEGSIRKNDWLYPLTPERYAAILTKVENELFETAKTNAEYLDNAWSNTVRNLETLFRAVAERSEGGITCDVTVIRDDTLSLQPAPTEGTGEANAEVSQPA